MAILLGNGTAASPPPAPSAPAVPAPAAWRSATSTATASSTSPWPTTAAIRWASCWATAAAVSAPLPPYSTGGMRPARRCRGRLQRRWQARPCHDQLGSSTVGVLLGNGSGGLRDRRHLQLPAATWPDAIAAADFNGDGKLDLAVANGFSNTVAILLGNGSGGFSAPPPPSARRAAGLKGIAAGDFNGDGKADLAVIKRRRAIPWESCLGNGSGSLGTANDLQHRGCWPQGIAVADFNGDGKPDLAVPTLTTATRGHPLRATAAGSFSAATVSFRQAPARKVGNRGRLQRRRPARPGRRQQRQQHGGHPAELPRPRPRSRSIRPTVCPSTLPWAASARENSSRATTTPSTATAG